MEGIACEDLEKVVLKDFLDKNWRVHNIYARRRNEDGCESMNLTLRYYEPQNKGEASLHIQWFDGHITMYRINSSIPNPNSDNWRNRMLRGELKRQAKLSNSLLLKREQMNADYSNFIHANGRPAKSFSKIEYNRPSGKSRKHKNMTLREFMRHMVQYPDHKKVDKQRYRNNARRV